MSRGSCYSAFASISPPPKAVGNAPRKPSFLAIPQRLFGHYHLLSSACCNRLQIPAQPRGRKIPNAATLASRISSAIGGPGSGGGAGEPAKKTSGGRTTVYIGIDVGGAEGTSSSTGRSTGCSSLAWASTLYSTLGSAAGFISCGGFLRRIAAGSVIGGGEWRSPFQEWDPARRGGCWLIGRHWQLTGVPRRAQVFRVEEEFARLG